MHNWNLDGLIFGIVTADKNFIGRNVNFEILQEEVSFSIPSNQRLSVIGIGLKSYSQKSTSGYARHSIDGGMVIFFSCKFNGVGEGGQGGRAYASEIFLLARHEAANMLKTRRPDH